MSHHPEPEPCSLSSPDDAWGEGEGPAPLRLRESHRVSQDRTFRLSFARALGTSSHPGFSCHSKLRSAQSGFSARMSFSFFSRRQPLISFPRIFALTTRPYSSYHTSMSKTYCAVKLVGYSFCLCSTSRRARSSVKPVYSLRDL